MLPRLWGSGKFSSIDTESLEYLRGLGVDYVWYTGLIRHATRKADEGCIPSHPQIVKGEAGSPYAITDYYDVNPYLADDPEHRMEEFLQLVNRTHAHGLKVIMDFVPNHVARDYDSVSAPAGVRSLGADDDTSVHWAPDNDFFYYPGETLRLPEPCTGSSYYEHPAKASGNCFSPTPGINDWYETIKVNYCDFHTPTWDKMYEIVRFWALKGVDGFRCDMVELVPPQFMQWLIARIKREFPQVIFIAEVYEKDKYRMYVEEVGFDLLYDKSGLYDTVRSVTCDGYTAKALTWNWQFLGDLQPRMLDFLENHDEQRVASDFFAGSAEAGYAALGVSLLLNTAPLMLYFGQEIGERGMDNEPFSGVNGRTSIFDWWTVRSLQDLRKYIGDGRKGLSVRQKSVLKRYREALALARIPAFAEGKTFDLGYCQGEGFDPDRHFAFLRSDGKETWLVTANFGPVANITVTIPEEACKYLGINLKGLTTLRVPSKDFVAIRVF
ncbi:MAG: alpha-amylase [Bacteroidales bacterium]|nr:alpha-amylase [Bacteroidales bacterium]